MRHRNPAALRPRITVGKVIPHDLAARVLACRMAPMPCVFVRRIGWRRRRQRVLRVLRLVLRESRLRTQQQVDKQLMHSIAALKRGDLTTEEVITELSRRLTQSLTHAPSKLLRKAAREGDNELLDFVVSGLKEANRAYEP